MTDVNDDKNMKKFVKALAAIDCVLPLVEYREPLAQPTAEMLEGLAIMYANKGIRTYLVNQINAATRQAALRTITTEDAAAGKMRILTLKELLVQARKAYLQKQRIETLRKQKEQAAEAKN